MLRYLLIILILEDILLLEWKSKEYVQYIITLWPHTFFIMVYYMYQCWNGKTF